MNRRLFSNIRETKQLTYDANFRCDPHLLRAFLSNTASSALYQNAPCFCDRGVT
jgi:predicted Zn-dependent peptidase